MEIDGERVARPAAGAPLHHDAMSVVRAVDEPVADGRYLLVSTHGWWTSFTSVLQGREGVPETRFASLSEKFTHCWIPADPAGDRYVAQHSSGRRIWVLGSEDEARADGLLDPRTRQGDLPDGRRARDADLRTGQSGPLDDPRTTHSRGVRRVVPPERGGWQQPDPRFLAGLPRDADGLLRRLRTDSPDTPWSGPFSYAVDALRTGMVPADLRAALYEALLRLEDVELVDRVLDVDGRVHLALRRHGPHRDRDLLIDRHTGHYAGERDVVTGDAGSLPIGITAATTSVLTTVVDEPGEVPPGFDAVARTGSP